MGILGVQLADDLGRVHRLDELPRALLVRALRADVPAGPGTADRERRAAALGRMEEVADVLLGRGLVRRRPAAVDPAAFEQERQAAVAELLAHRRPGLRRRQDLLRAEAVVRLLVVGHDLRVAGLSPIHLPLASWRSPPYAHRSGTKAWSAVPLEPAGPAYSAYGRTFALLGVLHRGRGIEDALDVGRLPVGRQAGLLEIVLAVVEPAHVEAVRDRPDACPCRSRRCWTASGYWFQSAHWRDVVVERLDVARRRPARRSRLPPTWNTSGSGRRCRERAGASCSSRRRRSSGDRS